MQAVGNGSSLLPRALSPDRVSSVQRSPAPQGAGFFFWGPSQEFERVLVLGFRMVGPCNVSLTATSKSPPAGTNPPHQHHRRGAGARNEHVEQALTLQRRGDVAVVQLFRQLHPEHVEAQHGEEEA